MYACANLSFLFKESGGLLARYRAAQKAGFKYVECDFPSGVTPNELKLAVQETGLKQLLINCYQGSDGQMGFAATPGSQDEFRKALETTMEYARATSCQKIHILSGKDLGPDNKLEQIKTLENNLEWAANILSKENIIGLIEPINPYSKPGYFLNSYEIAVSVLEKISSPYLRLQLDLFHLQMIAGNVSNNIRRVLPLTGHVQIAQSPHRHEPSFPGELNMKYVLSELKAAGYNGPIGCEYIPSGSTLDSLQWINEYGLEF